MRPNECVELRPGLIMLVLAQTEYKCYICRKTGQSPPSVLTLGLVWASSRPPKEQLSHMLDLIDERLDLAKEP